MAKQSGETMPLPRLPEEPVQRIVAPLERFLHVEAAAGVVLLACTVIALVLANSPWSQPFLDFWTTRIGFEIGSFQSYHSLQHWINDGLMAIFFFIIGLEVKRELVLGELRDVRRATVPIAAALGGMVVPAGIYLALQPTHPGSNGWGIPMATDIAFVVGCMAILGPRIPHGMRVMLLSLAIVDDIGAILVIAVGYTEQLQWDALALGVLGILFTLGLARIGVRNIGVYFVVGVLVWFAFHESGVHATIAGVILGLITPAKSWVSEGLLGEVVNKAGQVFRGEAFVSPHDRVSALRRMERATREAISPLERLETTLHPWMGFAIMPIFALANAGVPIHLSDLTAPVSLAIVLGLVVGKPVGIVLMSWLAVKLLGAKLPEGATWRMVVGGGFLAGIGFTMALFIANLALTDELLTTAKVGVLAGSVLAAVIGMTLLIAVAPQAPSAAPEQGEPENV